MLLLLLCVQVLFRRTVATATVTARLLKPRVNLNAKVTKVNEAHQHVVVTAREATVGCLHELAASRRGRDKRGHRRSVAISHCQLSWEHV